MENISGLQVSRECGIVGILKKVRVASLLLALAISTGIQIGNSWSTQSCHVEQSAQRQDSSTGFPSSLQSDTRSSEHCIAPLYRRARL